MISNMAAEAGNMAPEVREKAKNDFRLMETAIAQEVENRKLIPGIPSTSALQLSMRSDSKIPARHLHR